MKASIEISLYPLDSNYRERIVEFILRIKKYRDIEVLTNGMSTQIFGDYDVLMDLMKDELKTEFEQHRTMAVLKIGAGEMQPEGVDDRLR